MTESITQLTDAYRQSLCNKAQIILLAWQKFAQEANLDADLGIAINFEQLCGQPSGGQLCVQPESHRAMLHHALHRLAGSAPMYGFEDIGSSASATLHSLQDDDFALLRQNLAALIATMREHHDREG